MLGKELKRLNRKELVDVIYQLKKNEEELQEKLAALEAELQEKRIRVSVAGSIAEAATDITQIFAVAQRTADLYVQEVALMKAEAEKECAQMLADAKMEAARIRAEAQTQRG